MIKANKEIKTNIVDLADFDTAEASNKGADIELLHPVTNEPLKVFISVYGKDSEVFRDYTKQRFNEKMRKDAIASRKGKNEDILTAEELEERAIETLVLCTYGWHSLIEGARKNVIVYKGQELEYSITNAKLIYTECIWIRRQIDDAIGDLENFMKGLAN